MPSDAMMPERSRRQSWALLVLGLPLLAVLNLRAALLAPGALDVRAVVVSVVFGGLVLALRAATPAAAVAGMLACVGLSLATPAARPTLGASLLPPLVLLFVLTFGATRLGRARKEARGLAEARTGRRAAQVLANLGAAAACAALGQLHPVLRLAALAALAEATADTVSSEVGQAFGGTPVLLTTLRRVAAGTDGAISVAGTAAGVAAAAVVCAAGAMTLGAAAAAVALTAGVAGLFADTLLGATVERRGWLNNDLVNLSSTVVAATLAALWW